MAEDDTTHSYFFRVTVTARSRKEAERVIAERILFDDDYGFPYRIHIDGTANDPNGDRSAVQPREEE